MWARFLLFLLLFGIVEYRLIKDHYDSQLLEAAEELHKAHASMIKQDRTITELINITKRQHRILYDYERLIKKYQEELYNRETLNRRAIYESN